MSEKKLPTKKSYNLPPTHPPIPLNFQLTYLSILISFKLPQKYKVKQRIKMTKITHIAIVN